MRTTSRRVAALVAPVLALSVLASGPPAAADPSPAGSSAATWITGQLSGGRLFQEDYNNGFNIDAGFAELVMGNQAVAGQIRDAVAATVNGYISGDAFGDTGSTYANATAKSLAFAQESGGNPTSFGGVNLVSRLEGQVTQGANTYGRLHDTSMFGDFANTIGQAYAVQGLTTVGSPQAAAVTSFLLKQQCPSGLFRLTFAAPAAAEQSCTVDPPAPTGADVTAFVVLALRDQASNPSVADSVRRALAWLASQQASDGSFTDEDGKANSNSTGIAGWALGESCALPAANRAAAWVRTVQVQPGQTGPLAGDVGAIAFGPAELADAKANGITDEQQWKVSTSQATPGLGWDPAAAPTVSVAGPASFVKAGSSVNLTVTGAAAGERVCVTGPDGVRSLTGTGGPLQAAVTLPKKAGTATYSVTTGPGAATATLSLLAQKKLKVRLDQVVSRGDRQRVAVKGLAKKEKVKVLVDGKVVAKGKANRKGRFVDAFLVKLRPGKHTLKVVGQFKNRSGVTTFRVVR